MSGVTAMDGRNLADDADSDLKIVLPDKPPTLDINQSGNVSGFDGCNGYVGGMEFGSNGYVKADLRGGIATLMACLGKRGALSNQFSGLTRTVTHWRTEGNSLILETSDKKIVRLKPAA